MSEGIPLGPRENSPSSLAGAIENLGIDNRIARYLLGLERADQDVVETRVFNSGTASIGDLQHIENDATLGQLQSDIEALLTLEHKRAFDDARVAGSKLALDIESAAS